MIDKNILGRTGEKAYGINYAQLSTEQQQWLDDYVRNLGLPPGPPTQQGLYASPAATGKPYPSPPKQNANQNQETPEGWPRQPVFNPPGNVPGPPIQFGDPIKPADVTAGDGFVGNGLFEKDIFYYHNDHLGSTSYISTMNGQLSQHVEYIAFGEVLFEEHSSSFSMPYLFNGKELDRETNLTYYGARYLDMKTSLWLNIDPLAEKFPHASPYNYCLGNPIRLTDPTGMEPVDERNNDERKIDITVPISSGYESNLQKLLNINKTGTAGINPDGDSDDSGLNHAMHLGDDNGYDKNGKQVNNKGGDTTDYLYDEKGNIIDSTPVQFRAVSQGEFRELGGFRGYGVKGFPMATGAINDDSLNFTTNLVGAGEIYHGGKLIAMGFTKVLKSSVGVRTVLGGSKYTLKSSVYFEKMIGSKSINVLGVKSLPTLYGRSTTWGTFLGRNAPIIGTGRIGFGGYLISN